MAEGRIRHAWLRALGPAEMPPRIDLADGPYRHLRTFKHDFFAATGLYQGPSGRVILKLGRVARLFGLPMVWIGELSIRHESTVYRALEGVPGVPRWLGTWGRTGLVHVYLEGHPLQRYERVDDDFFPRLRQLIDEIHRRDIAYVDLEKRENILVTEDGSPGLIDFQVAWRWPPRTERRGPWRLLSPAVGQFVLAVLQNGDRYHLLKHQRRHRPDTLTPHQRAMSRHKGQAIAMHRVLSRPLTKLRRKILKRLTGRERSPKQEGPEFCRPVLEGPSPPVGPPEGEGPAAG